MSTLTTKQIDEVRFMALLNNVLRKHMQEPNILSSKSIMDIQNERTGSIKELYDFCNNHTLLEMAKGNVWQPIETAPIDISIIIHRDDGEIEIVDEDHNDSEWNAYYPEKPWSKPTHWMPLPTPPKCSDKNMDERSELPKESEEQDEK